MTNARWLLLLAALTAALLALAAALRTNEPGDPFGDYGHVQQAPMSKEYWDPSTGTWCHDDICERAASAPKCPVGWELYIDEPTFFLCRAPHAAGRGGR